MPGIGKTQKVCATCQYWMGFRDISKGASFVNFQQKGICTSARSSYRDNLTSGTQACNWWHKWTAL